MSLLARGGETGRRSGLNWGQRDGREPNQAYIPLPASVARSGFFPLNRRQFSVLTDDGIQLIQAEDAYYAFHAIPGLRILLRNRPILPELN